MQNTQLQNLIVCNFLKHFPESHYSIHKHVLDSGFYINFYLGKPKEWPNKISNNDPLQLTAHYWTGLNEVELTGSIFLNPTNQYMYGSTLRFRKKTLPNTKFNEKEFDKYFANVKANILSQQENWHHTHLALMNIKLF